VEVRTPRKKTKVGEDSNDDERVREGECDEEEDKKIKLCNVLIPALSTKSSLLNDTDFFLPKGKN
jgi:hypothetical protein